MQKFFIEYYEKLLALLVRLHVVVKDVAENKS